MNKKKYCVFDNPATMCREAWIDGRKVAFIEARWIAGQYDTEYIAVFGSLNGWGRWETGKIQGDKDALYG